MSVLVDSSIWVDYFRGKGNADALELLIEENLIVVNDLILAELVPPLLVRKEKHLISLLREIKRQTLSIQWDEIIHLFGKWRKRYWYSRLYHCSKCHPRETAIVFKR